MASCKDCISYGFCNEHWLGIGDMPNLCSEEYICEHFKDRNRFVELPCNFMQKCFVIPTIENNLSDITEMKCIGYALSNGLYNANLITDKNKLYQPCFGAFGKTVFLTREEAERALKGEFKNGRKRT